MMQARSTPRRLACALAALAAAGSLASYAGNLPREPIDAQFRGCDERVCRFSIASGDTARTRMIEVVPRGVPQVAGDRARSRAIRDRLNALLSSMIHQHKQVALHGLRARDDATFEATVTVNGADVAADAQLAGEGGAR